MAQAGAGGQDDQGLMSSGHVLDNGGKLVLGDRLDLGLRDFGQLGPGAGIGDDPPVGDGGLQDAGQDAVCHPDGGRRQGLAELLGPPLDVGRLDGGESHAAEVRVDVAADHACHLIRRRR
nr:hypothetical protein [Terrabacter sp. MAHUQ-38]